MQGLLPEGSLPLPGPLRIVSEETFRGGVHFTAGMLFSVMAAWNCMRLVSDGSPRHAVNLAIYGPLVLFEGYNTWTHWHKP